MISNAMWVWSWEVWPSRVAGGVGGGPQTLGAMPQELGSEEFPDEIISLVAIWLNFMEWQFCRTEVGLRATMPLILKGYLMSFEDATESTPAVIKLERLPLTL